MKFAATDMHQRNEQASVSKTHMQKLLCVGAIGAGLLLAGCSSLSRPAALAAGSPSSSVIAEAQALQAQGQREQATAVLRVAAVKNPNDRELRAAYGKSLLNAGQVGDAERVLAQAHTPDRPDPTVLSAQGVAAAQKGDYATALAFFDRSLNLRQDPRVMSNKAMTLALAGRLPEAEALAQEAAGSPEADARVRQSYALVLAMQGKTDAAAETYARDLSADQAAANVALVQKMRRQGV